MKRDKRSRKQREVTARRRAEQIAAGKKEYKRWLDPKHFAAMDKLKEKLEKANV